MERNERIDDLLSLRIRLAEFQAVKCRMRHERIKRVPGSLLPVTMPFPEGSYERIGFCAPEVRALRLACGHTMARAEMRRAIVRLEEYEGSLEATRSRLLDELIGLNNAIHLLDHRKGDAEIELAQAEEASQGASGPIATRERLAAAEADLLEIALLHDQYVDRMEALRDAVVAEIDRLIELG